MRNVSEKIAVLGLGYVGLPVAMAFSKVCDRVVGFDISHKRVDELKVGYDRTGEMTGPISTEAR